jgi:site-specific DNA-cytosine methylase
MIAGTACVDFSPLNSKQKDIEGGGESGKTFQALLEYGRKYRPRIVIMENVRGAPWKEFAEAWSGIGYDAFHSIVDSKNYYIPQTRIRGYMVCVDNERRSENAGKESFGADWVTLLKAMKRQASSPAGMFLLEEDDHRLEQISKDSVHAWSAPRGEVEWARYQERHKQHRSCKALGDRRPISRSLPGGTISMPPDFFWPHFFKAQVERVWETLDIKFLVNLLKGVDMNFKE